MGCCRRVAHPAVLTAQAAEAAAAYGTASLAHPGTRMIALERGPIYLGGRLHGISFPQWCAAITRQRPLRNSIASPCWFERCPDCEQ